jgi:L-threonylcarbamoyladenylate synthase
MNRSKKADLGDKIFIAPTDTVYGILGSAFSKKAAERIFKVKGRDDNKPLIVLVSSLADLKKFGICLSLAQERFLKQNWPNKLSIELPQKKFPHIHRGNNFNAFRMPRGRRIVSLLKEYGPLVAPSANKQGEKTVETIREARKVFGNEVDFYISNRKRLRGKSSTLITLDQNGVASVVRQGTYKL